MSAQGSNGFEAAQRWVDEIEKHQETKKSIMMKAVADCGPVEKMIKDAKAAAKNAGISPTLLGKALKERDLLRKVVKNRGDLDDEAVDDFEQLISALKPVADLPLFGAAIDHAEVEKAKAEKKKAKAAEGRAAMASLLPKDAPGVPDQVKNNVVALNEGIKPLQ